MAKIAAYVRVSTDEQSVDRQIDSTTQYAVDRLDAELSELDIYRDKSTGTDTERSGYQDLVDDLDELDAVLC